MRVLHHAYVKEGEPLPRVKGEDYPIPPSWIFHIAGSSNDTGGLDIWWWEEDE